MKLVLLGAHLERGDIEPLATAVAVGDLYLSALEVPVEQPVADRDVVVRAAQVRAALLERATFIAIRYGVTVTSEGDALGKCAAHLDRWRALLTQHREEIEMTLKVAAATSTTRPQRANFTSGSDYLRALHAATSSVAVDQPFRTSAEELLGAIATEKRWNRRDQSSLELALLVRRDRVEEIARAGILLKERHSHVPFLLSGPWPLETFANADQ